MGTPPDHIARARAALAHGIAGAPDQWQIRVLVHTPGHYRGARAVMRATRGQHSVIIKTYERPGRARAVFDRLTALHDATAQIVAPLAVDEARNLTVMADAGAFSLLSSLETCTQTQATEAALAWLDRFQSHTAAQTLPFDASAILAEKALQFAHVPAPHNRHCDRLAKAMQTRFGPFQGRPLPHVTCLGDFKPDNLCHSGDISQLIAIDPVDIAPQPREYDVAFFLVWMQVHGWRMRLQSARIATQTQSRTNLRRAHALFKPPLDPALLEAFAFSFSVDKWVKLAMQGAAPDLQRRVEIRLGLRHNADLFRPSLRRIIGVFRNR